MMLDEVSINAASVCYGCTELAARCILCVLQCGKRTISPRIVLAKVLGLIVAGSVA